MSLMLKLILYGGSSLRGASRVFEVVVSYFNLPYKVPSWYTCRLWLLRLGYYKLNRLKEKGSDWVLFIDHTVQLDETKCLLMLGMRLRDLPPKGQPIQHKDLEPIELFPVTKSNGEVVYEQLESAVKKIGIPRAIISDHGSDLKTGVERFIQTHPETISLYDIKHKTAVILKRELNKDENWEAFTKKASQTQNSIRQTNMYAFSPPTQKSKARYMNLVPLVEWGVRSLFYLQADDLKFPSGVTREKLQDKLGWVIDFKDSLARWDTLMMSITTVESFVRDNGLEHGSLLALKREVSSLPTNEQTRRIQSELLSFVEQESMKAMPNERLPGSTESLESTFGKLKTIQGQQNKSGFTGFILSVAAIVAPNTISVIYNAMKTTKTSDPIKWSNENLGSSTQSKRKALSDQFKKQNIKSEQAPTTSEQNKTPTSQKKTSSDTQQEITKVTKTKKIMRYFSNEYFVVKYQRFLRKYKEVKPDQFRLTG